MQEREKEKGKKKKRAMLNSEKDPPLFLSHTLTLFLLSPLSAVLSLPEKKGIKINKL